MASHEAARSPRGMTRTEILTLPAAIDLDTANRALSLGRSKGYDLAKCGRIRAGCCGSATPIASSPPTSSSSWALILRSALTAPRRAWGQRSGPVRVADCHVRASGCLGDFGICSSCPC